MLPRPPSHVSSLDLADKKPMATTSRSASDVGRRRDHNEDAYFVDDGLQLYVVADGMGGHAAGEVASRLAVESIENFVRRSRDGEDYSWPYGIDTSLTLDGNRLRTGFLQEHEWPRLTTAAGRLADGELYIDDTAGLSALEIRAKSRRLYSETKGRLALIVIDYLQLVRGDRRYENRNQEMSAISRSLKGLAEIIIGKQRNGPIGTVTLAFHKSLTRFENLTKVRE